MIKRLEPKSIYAKYDINQDGTVSDEEIARNKELLELELKEEKSEEVQYAHRGLANRSFERQWTITDDVEIKEVIFEDGLLTINLGKVVPEHHARHDWL